MGSINKTTIKSGDRRWVARWRTPAGDSREKWFDTRKAAERHLNSIEATKTAGTYVDPRLSKITVADWSRVWLDTKADKKAKTLAGYRSILDCHILPVFSDRRLDMVQSEDVARWLASLKASGLSGSRVRQAFAVLNGLLRMAHQLGRLPRNPAEVDVVRSMVPKPSRGREVYLTHDQVDALVAHIGRRYEVLVLTLAYVGLRWGEATALRRGRVEVLRRRFHICESVTEVGGEFRWGTPKSGRDRHVDVPLFLAERLGEHLQDVGPDPESLIFTTPRGLPVRNSNFRHRTWRSAIEAAELPGDLKVHDLRHTAASFMIAKGAPLSLVQRQLGHSSVTVTERYAHLYPSQGEELARRLDARYRASRGAGVGLEPSVVVPMAR